MSQPESNHRRPDPRCRIVLLVVLLLSFLLRLHHLGHPGLTTWDEVFHAVVATSLAENPLRPTLISPAYVEFDYRDWYANEVWLHKPPMAMWQIAGFFALFGVDTFVLRLPSLLLMTASVALCFLIGRRLLDERSALVGATLFAFQPTFTRIVHGYNFADHVDASLVFYVLLSLYALLRFTDARARRWLLLAGVAQGLAWLSKTHLAFLVTGLAGVMALLPRLARDADGMRLALRWRDVAVLLGVMLLTIAPWCLWCVAMYRREFVWENLEILRHLNRDVEQWAAPWDRLANNFIGRPFREAYPLLLVSVGWLFVRTARERSAGLLLLSAWIVGVMLPHLIAVSKTPTATVIGWPALLLAMGWVVTRAWQGRRVETVILVTAAVLTVLLPLRIPPAEWGYPPGHRWGGLVWENRRALAHVVTIALVATIAARLWRSTDGRLGAGWRPLARGVAIVVTLLIVGRFGLLSYRYTEINARSPDVEAIAALARAEPAGTVLVFTDAAARFEQSGRREQHMNLHVTFHSGVVAIRQDKRDLRGLVKSIRGNGGLPLLVTLDERPELRLRSQVGQRRVYAWDEPGTPAGPD